MAITYKLNNHRVSFYWDKANELWTAESKDLNNLHLQAKNFNSLLRILKNQYPELKTSIRIFFPDAYKAVA